MSERTIMASQFKARCLKLIDQVAESRTSYVITKHGKPRARLVPLEDDGRPPLQASVRLLSDQPSDYYSTGESWEVDSRHAVE